MSLEEIRKDHLGGQSNQQRRGRKQEYFYFRYSAAVRAEMDKTHLEA